MEPDLSLNRLMELPASHELSVPDLVYVLNLSEASVKRILKKGAIEHKAHEGRGETARNLRASKAAVVRYLVKVTKGDKAAILAAIAAQCPQFLPIAQGLPTEPAPAITAANIVPFMKAYQPRKRSPKPADICPGHPELFPFPAQTA